MRYAPFITLAVAPTADLTCCRASWQSFYSVFRALQTKLPVGFPFTLKKLLNGND